MTLPQALFMALLQGATELFPVSSLGHAVIAPALLGWRIDTHDIAFLPFLVLLHVGTGLALLIYFRRDWIELLGSVIGKGPVNSTAETIAANRRLFWLLALATMPAVIVGGLLDPLFRVLFARPLFAAIFLMINGVVLIFGERLKKAPGAETLATLSWRRALLIGASQCAALFPGISRSGVTIVSGLGTGLKHEEAARFSFLLATPIIFAAAALEVPKLHTSGAGITGLAVLAGVVAGLTAYASVALLMRYFGKQEIRALNPFGYYCLIAGALSLAVIVTYS